MRKREAITPQCHEPLFIKSDFIVVRQLTAPSRIAASAAFLSGFIVARQLTDPSWNTTSAALISD